MARPRVTDVRFIATTFRQPNRPEFAHFAAFCGTFAVFPKSLRMAWPLYPVTQDKDYGTSGRTKYIDLKLADKLIREGNLAGALAAIQKARQEDPSNRYAEAYEERVLALMPPRAGNDSRTTTTAQRWSPRSLLNRPCPSLKSLTS